MPSFHHSSSPKLVSPGHFNWSADQSWFQGRGLYGGLTFAALVRAIEQSTPLPLRRLSVELCAPLSEEQCDIHIHQARRGASSQFLSLELRQQGQIMLIGTAACAADRDLSLDRSPIRRLPSPSVPPIPATPLMPAFSQHFEYRLTTGELPMSAQQSQELLTGGWLQPRHPAPRDTALVLGLLDAWWPALFLAIDKARTMGTISFAVDILNPPITSPGPFYVESRTEHCLGGYAVEENEIWDHRGQLLAKAQQRVALIR